MSLRLFLVRHAVAEDLAAGTKDADRRLTEEGRRRMARAARGLRRIEVVPDRIVSSPLRRATETAAILARELVPGLTVEIAASLAPGCEPATLVHWLAAARPGSAIVLVGHQPGMGRLASFLLTGSPQASPLSFKKGAVAALHPPAGRSPGSAELEWFLTPRQLRAMAAREE